MGLWYNLPSLRRLFQKNRGGRMTFTWFLFWIMFTMFVIPVLMALLDEVVA